jgi:hypothetical protein
MSFTVIKQPTSTQTPDATLGGLAVTGITATGHGSTVTSSSANGSGSDADEKSARWFGIPAFGGFVIVGKRLKLSWTASGSAGALDDGIGGSSAGNSSFIIEYSLNGGGSWNLVVTDDAAAIGPGVPSDSFTNNASADIALSVGQDISQIQVRADYLTSASASGGAGNTGSGSVTVTVSGIQVEVTYVDPGPGVFIA